MSSIMAGTATKVKIEEAEERVGIKEAVDDVEVEDNTLPVSEDEFKVDVNKIKFEPEEVQDCDYDQTQPSTSTSGVVKIKEEQLDELDCDSDDSDSMDINEFKEEPPEDDEEMLSENDNDVDPNMTEDIELKFEATEETLQDAKGNKKSNTKRKYDEIDSDVDEWSSSEESSDDYENSDDADEESDTDNKTEQIKGSPDVPWSNGPGPPRPALLFTGSPGIQIATLNKHCILEIFESFFTDELINIIVKATNGYANQFIKGNMIKLKKKSRLRKWVATDSKEIRTFIGLLILQGISPKPQSRLYFSRRESIATPFFPKIITENRFVLLHKFLHFNNDYLDYSSSRRKLFKIMPVLNYLREKFMSVYIPSKNVCLVKSLIGWKRRQFSLSKRKGFRTKLLALCESQSGYVYNFLVYTGTRTVYGDGKNKPISSKIVLELAHKLLNKGYCIYTDNCFTSIKLIDKLVQNQTDCVGMIRKNNTRIPRQIKATCLENGEFIAMHHKNQMILKWMNKHALIFGTSIHTDSIDKIKIKGNILETPSVVKDYNLNMENVDLIDNLQHLYAISRQIYITLFHHFVELTIVNCHEIYKKLGGEKTKLNFQIELAERIIEKYAEKANVSERRSRIPKPTRLIERHFPEITPRTEKKAKPTKRCHVCYENGIRKETIYWCKECATGLCPAPCFKYYHTKE